MLIDDEERKRREQEAINIINSVNAQHSNIDMSSADQEYVDRVNRANAIIDSINPRNVPTSTVTDEERVTALQAINALTPRKKIQEVEEQQELQQSEETKQTSKSLKSKEEIEKELEEVNKNNIQTVNPNIKEDTIKNASKVDSSLFNLANPEETKNTEKFTEDSTLAATLEASKINEQLKHATPKEKLEIWLANQGDNFFSSLVKKPISGLVNIGTTLAGLGIKGVQGVAALFGNTDLENSLKEPYDNVIQSGQDVKNNADYTSKVTQQINDPFIKVSGQANDIISYMMGNAAIGYATGINPTVMQGLTVGGNSAAEVLEKNKDNVFQAGLTGVAKGYTSYLTESMFDANILTKYGNKSSVEKFINNQISERLKSEFGKELANKTVGIIGENLEEFAEDNVGYLIDKLVNNEEMPGFKEWLNSTSETVGMTTLTTFVMQLLGLGSGSFSEIEKDMEAQKWINEAQKIIDKENLGIHFNTNEVKDLDTIQDYYITKFTPDGDILGVVPTKGVTIQNANSDLNVTPVVVRDSETGNYNIIDGNTGVMLDSTYYDTRLQAEESYNEKVNKLSDLQIKEINNRVAEAGTNINAKVMDMINQAQEEVNAIESNYQEQQNTPTQFTQDNAESNFYTPKTNYAVPDINQLKNEFEKNKTYSKDELYDKWYDDIVENELDMIYNEADPDKTTFIQLEKENGELVLKQYSGENEEAIKSVTIPAKGTGVYTSEDIQNAIEQAATMYDENRPIKGQVDIEGNEVRSMKKGVSENEGKRSRNVRQEANRKQEGKNTRGEKENGQSNELAKREQSKGISNYQKQQQKTRGKDFKATIVETNNQSKNEQTVSKGFKETTGLDVNIYTTNQSTSEGAFYNANSIFLKHNSLANKKSVNFRTYHEFGHWLKDNKPEQWNKLYDIVDQTITKQQIEDYKNVLNDKSKYNSMSETEVRNDIINEIVSDYVGNWANDIMNWEEYLPQLSKEYTQFLADIALENEKVGYNMFGSIQQQKEINTAISNIMKEVIEGDIKYSDRDDVDINNENNYNDIYEDENEYIDSKNNIWLSKSNKGISLDTSEKERLNHELEKIYANKPNKSYSKEIRNHFYRFRKNGEGNFTILTRIGIEGNKEIIDLVKEYDKDETITRTENTNRLLERIANRSRYNNNDNDISKGKEENVKIDRLYSERNNKQKGNDTRKNNRTSRNNSKDSLKSSFIIPKKVTEIQNLNKFLDKAIEQETDKYWKEQLKEAQAASYIDWTRKESRLQWKRRLVQQYLDYKNGIEYSNRKDIEDERKIQGLENYTISELKEAFKADVETILEENGIDDVNIIDIDLHGSRLRGTAKNNSDLDVVVQYDGDIREDDLFNILNEEPLEIEGIKVDFNPIQEDLKSYMERSNEYDQEILSKDSEGNELTKAQQDFFKDSKARDDNGNLMVMYHGTKDNFTIFDNSKKKYDSGFAGQGFYFTNNYEIAKNYSEWKKGNNDFTPKVMQTYLNIKNPLVLNEFNGGLKTAINEALNLKLNLKNIAKITESESKNITNKLIDNGYDGIIWEFDGDKMAMVINPNQIKNIDNKNPTSDPDIRYSDRYDTDENGDYGFYSQLEKVIEEKMPNTSNAQQINGILNNAGIKQDEMKWIGLDDYLKAHSLEKITKQQVMDYIKANQIYIETVQKGDSKIREMAEPIKQEINNIKDKILPILKMYRIKYDGMDLRPFRLDGTPTGLVGDFMPEGLERLIDLNNKDLFEKEEKDGKTNYSTLYSGNTGTALNMFTIEKMKDDMKKLSDLYDELFEQEHMLHELESQDNYEDVPEKPKYKSYKLDGGTNYQERLYTVPGIKKVGSDKYEVINNAVSNVSEYRSPHWNEKNVLAHTRTQDFEDINGNKVLFIDEIQSDLHQEGRKKGYITEETNKRKQELANKINDIKDTKMNLEENLYNINKKVKEDLLKYLANKQTEILNKRKKYDINEKLTIDEQYELVDFQDKMNQIYSTVIEKHNIFNVNNQQNMIDLLKSYAEYHLSNSIKDKFKNNMKELEDYIIDTYRLEYSYDRYTDIEKGWSTLREDELKDIMTNKEYNERKKMIEENQNLFLELDKLEDEYKNYREGISDVFPFKKNWHEFALRRIINDAVSQGYDEIAWTTGRQQRERYNLSQAIDYIEYQRLYDHPKDVDSGKVGTVEITAYKDGNNVFDRQIPANELADYIGKDLSMRIFNAKEGKGTITNLDEDINRNGNSGMYLFYDQEIPSYLNKYLKKWDSKVETITLKDADGKKESVQPGFKITDKMRNSIKQDGQPLYSNRIDLEEDTTTTVNTQEQEERREIARKVKNGDYNLEKVQRNAERENAYIEQEIQKLERTGNWDTSIPVTKLSDIRKVIEDYLGLGIKKGHFREHAYGIYKTKRDVIRTKEFKDMDTILHETGHALDLGNRLKVDKESIANELLQATAKHGGYENETRTVQLEEGFAEVIREYSVVPEQAKTDYPQSVAIIEGLRSENKQFDNFMNKVQKLTYNYIHQVPENRILSNVSIGEQTDQKNITKNYIKQEIMRNVYDSNYALKSAVNELAKADGKTTNTIKASDNAYYLTRLASGITDKVTSMLSDGYIDENGNKLMPGLNKLGEILGNDSSRFNDLRAYLVARRDTDYKAKTLKTGLRSMDSKAVIEQFQNDKQIQEAAKLVYDTLDGVLQYAVNNHLIDQETASALRESNTFYVPMQRVLENDRGNQIGRRGAVADIIKQRTGSELDIKDVLENIITNSSNVIQQVENNNVLKALYKQGESSGVTNAIYDVIPAPMTKIGTQKLGIWESELINQGVKTSKLDLEKTVDIFAPSNKVDAQNLITSFINDNGKRVYLQFYDDLIFNNIMGMDKKFMSQVLKFNSKLNMPLRYGATMANIGFAIPNMISDTAQAAVFSTAGFVPVVDNVLGVLDILSAKSKLVQNFVKQVAPDYANRVNFMYDLFKQTGSTNSTRMSQYRQSAQSIMNEIYGTNGSTLGIKEKFKPLKRLLDLLTYIPDISEQSTRFRVFQKNYEYYQKRGNSEMDSRILAALEARDATQDFSRTGNVTREINQLIPFSAARVGSAYTFSEKVSANPKTVAFRTSILLALAMAIKAIGYDDDEIDELQQRKKDDNFVMRVGDKIITIKKPQGVLRSTINLVEYIQDLVTGHIDEGKEGERLGKWINNAIMDNMPSDEITGLVPNAVAPLIENAINKDFYYNTDIVKSYDQDLPDYMQYYDYNSQLAIWLGKVFNYSPAKIDNLISGYFGGLGTQTTNIMDTLLGKMGIIPEKPNMGAEQNSIGKRFVVNVNTNSQSIDDLYNRKTELTKKKNGGTITKEETKELEKITNTLTNVSKLNKQIREIKSSTSLNGNQKADQIKSLQQQKTDLARETLNKDLINETNKNKNASIDFFPSTDSLKKNNYSLALTPEMKKEYEKYAYEYYSKYEKQGLYSEEKLKDIKSKAKEYAKTYLFQKYKDRLALNKGTTD